jgi:hypothetical protein
MKLGPSLQVHQNLSMKRLKLQRRIAKWPIRSGLALTLAMVTAACAPHGETSAVSAVAGWNGDESPAYRSGHAAGSLDKREGRSYAPASAATSENYATGYAAGYRSPHDNPWSRRRAQELGEARGRADKKSGQPADPERHSGEVPRSVRDDFRRGYRAGWN